MILYGVHVNTFENDCLQLSCVIVEIISIVVIADFV